MDAQLRSGVIRYDQPLAAWTELEADGAGGSARVLTILLAAPQCTLRCVHCDLAQHAVPDPVPAGCVPKQIEWSLARNPGCDWIKLYNGGNFVDPRSVPVSDHALISARCRGFSRVIVENHPRMAWRPLVDFAARLDGRLEVAMGLETCDESVLGRLDKRMTPHDFMTAVQRLIDHEIDVRAFVVAGLPWSGASVVESTERTVVFARCAGSRHVSIIPMRTDTAQLQELERQGVIPRVMLRDLELILERTVGRDAAVITVDPWDLDRRGECAACDEPRRARIRAMNLSQRMELPIGCARC